MGDVPLDFDAHLPNVWHRLVRSHDYGLQDRVEVVLAVDREGYLFERVYRCYFEVKAGIFVDDVHQLRDKSVDPANSVDPSQVADALNSC